MATIITSECINCGACEPECPNTAIYQGAVEWDFNGETHAAISDDIFYIVPQKCTECVGFHDQEACAAVCPVDCCVPDPDNLESEEVLIARAQQLHPEETFGDDFPSRFRVDGAGATAPAAKSAPQGNGKATGVAEPAPTATTPAVSQAAASKVAAATASARPAEPSKPGKAPAKATPKKTPVEKVFPGELAGSYGQALARVQQKKANPILGSLLAAALPILGALPFSTKKALEESLGDHTYYNAATATGLNILFNMMLYPGIFLATYVAGGGNLFSQGVNGPILLGLTLASVETIVRLRESLFQGVPSNEATFRGAFYGLPLAPLLAPFLNSPKARSVERGQIAIEGYSTPEFGEKVERARRYGEVYTIEDEGNAYLVRMELPRSIPVSAAKREMGIGDEMPDYDYEIALHNGGLLVKGKVSDPDVRKLAAISSAFPPDFTRLIELKAPVASFKHRYHDKTLEVVVFKR